jgi:hypothetical protein
MAAAMRADKKVVEVIMTTTTIIMVIEIRRLTRTLLVIFVPVFLLVTSVVTSLVVLMTARPVRMCTASNMTLNMPPMSQTVYSSSLISHLAKEFQAREAQEI